MDIEAVCGADDKTLKELGIDTCGDLVALRVFCKRKCLTAKEQAQKQERENKKKRLLSILKSGESSGEGSSGKSKKMLSGKRETVDNKKKRLELGWLHQACEGGLYVSVRAKDGGGTRIVELPGNSRKSDIISYGKRLFFPNGSSPLASSDELLFQLGNYKQEQIQTTVTSPDGTVHPFTLYNYSKSNKLSKTRLYIMTRKMDESDSDREVSTSMMTIQDKQVAAWHRLQILFNQIDSSSV